MAGLLKCSYCGKGLDKNEVKAKCSSLMGLHSNQTFIHEFIGQILCKDCAKKCKKCGKYFCPKHINKHYCG